MSFLPTLRELVRTYQSFVDYSAPHIKQMNLTHSQFDVIATLGNQTPMTCKEIGEKTLITKGTLTGVLERLEDKGLIKKYLNTEDGRSYKTGLTKEGQKVFDKSFNEHLAYLEKAFGKLSKKDLETTATLLKSLRKAFETI
jgi:MarR family 2-MHQ and catechol resistance regulon transcriptional repressor